MATTIGIASNQLNHFSVEIIVPFLWKCQFVCAAGRTGGAPSVGQLDRSIHAPDDYEQGRNTEAEEHPHNASGYVCPACVFGFLACWDGPGWTVEAVTDNKFDSKERVEYDRNL
jgi:hypothetical protein